MRILYLGLPLGAVCLVREGLTPTVVGVGHPGEPGNRRVRRALGRRGTLVLGRPDLEAPSVRRVLEAARPDVVLSWFWPYRIPEHVLELARLGGFGVHPSLLPELRGPDPYFWAIQSGATETGVTLHRLSRDYDTGAIIEQRRVQVASGDNSWSLARRLDRPSLQLLVKCARDLSAGRALEARPQEESAATWARRPGPQDLAIDWHGPVAAVERLVRAAAPAPSASALLGRHEVEVLAVQVFDGPMPRALQPAEAWIAPGGVVVRAADGGVLLNVVRLRDGTRLEGESVAELLPNRQS